MYRIVMAVIAIFFSMNLYAKCPGDSLHGEWQVFYQDNSQPDSILAPDKNIVIDYSRTGKSFRVEFEDPKWESKGEWKAKCNGEKLVLSGLIKNRRSPEEKNVSIFRVTEVENLVARKGQVAKWDQLGIIIEGDPATGHEGVVQDPGHSHADR